MSCKNHLLKSGMNLHFPPFSKEDKKKKKTATKKRGMNLNSFLFLKEDKKNTDIRTWQKSNSYQFAN